MPRGGKRPGAGRKPKALVDKLADGNVGHRTPYRCDDNSLSTIMATAKAVAEVTV